MLNEMKSAYGGLNAVESRFSSGKNLLFLLFHACVVAGITHYSLLIANAQVQQDWVARYNGSGNSSDVAKSIAVDGSGNVYVTGYSIGSGTDNDFATIKYSQPVGITPVSNEIPKDFSLSQNYPNPFNPTTKIRFALPKSSLAKLVVYDILGREVATIVNEQLNRGTYEVEWSADEFSSGIYYYKLTVRQAGSSIGDFTETKKMILLK